MKKYDSIVDKITTTIIGLLLGALATIIGFNK